MSTSSMVSRRGLKCNKVRRVSDPDSVPTATAPIVSSPLTNSPSSTFLRVYSSPAPKLLAKLPSWFEPAISDRAHLNLPLSTLDARSTEAGPAGVLSKRSVNKAEPNSPLSIIQSTSCIPSPSASSLTGIQSSAAPTSGGHFGSSMMPTAEGARLLPRTSSETAGLSQNDLSNIIAGSLLGVLGFVAITALTVILLLRRRRRLYGDVKSIGSNGKLSRMSRNSTPTLTGWNPRHQSSVSFGTPTPQSLSGHARHASEPLATPKPVMLHKRFSKSTELSTAAPVDPHGLNSPRGQFSDPEVNNRQLRLAKPGSCDLQTIQEKPEGYPSKPEPLFTPRSLYSSDRSIGSTIILPSRNSSVGSLQALSYRLSSPLRLSASTWMPSPGVLSPLSVEQAVRRSSTRSDPFDLEVPVDARHSRPQLQQ